MRGLLGVVLTMVGCSIPNGTFAPSLDAPQRDLVISETSLDITEGQSKTFTVELAERPADVVRVAVESTSPAVTCEPPTIDFTPENFAQPVTISVGPATDSNNISETSTVSLRANGLSTESVAVLTVDATVLGIAGWPPPAFPSTTNIAANSLVTYQVTISENTNLDKFGVFIPAGTGFYRMALYSDASNSPGSLLGQIAARTAIVNGENLFDLALDVPIDISMGTLFWIAIRTSSTTAISFSDTAMGRLCVRLQDITSIDDAWPATFGTANCSDEFLMNLWITTQHQ